jgi:hypothetical protein
MVRKLVLALASIPLAALRFDRGQPTPESYRFNASPDKPAQFDAAPADAAKARRFSGVAYSGDVIEGHWYWDRVVFDLSTTKTPQKLPMLMGHDREKIAGFSDSVEIGGDIKIAGALSSKTDFGKEVAGLSDEGFPWQMSVHIEPRSIEEVAAGQSVTVNGRQFTGPINVFRNNVIREVSFTPTGWDAQTSATAMSRGGNQHTDQGVDMTPEEIAALKAQAALASKFEADAKAALEAKAKAEAEKAASDAKVKEFEAKATAEAKAKREADVKALFAATGIKHTPELAKPYEAMDADTFAAVSTQMREAAKVRSSDNPALFSEQARRGTADLSSAEEIAEAAQALVFAAEKQGKTLLIEDAVRQVARKAA